MIRIVFLFFIASISQGFTQTVGGIKAGGIDVNAAPGGVIQEVDFSTPITTGTAYLKDSWSVGSLYFYGENKILNKPLKYDLENGMIEVKFSEKVKSVKDIWIKKMRWINTSSGMEEVFINGKDLTINGTQLTGLYKFIDLHGKYSLLLRYSVVYSKGTYVPVFDAGNKENKIRVENEPYLYLDGSVIELPKKRNNFFQVFGDNNKELVKEFVKSKQLNTRKTEDILEIVKYVNLNI